MYKLLHGVIFLYVDDYIKWYFCGSIFPWVDEVFFWEQSENVLQITSEKSLPRFFKKGGEWIGAENTIYLQMNFDTARITKKN